MDESVKLREDRQLLEQDREVAYRFSAESQPADDIPVLEREDWPDPRLLKLDASQYEAMYRALTKEFSIIQVMMMVVVMLMMMMMVLVVVVMMMMMMVVVMMMMMMVVVMLMMI